MYRVTIAEKTKDPYGDALEILGSYNPHTKELQIKADRVQHWLSNGAQMTSTVNNLLIDKGVIKGDKVAASKNKPSKKAPVEPKVEAPKKESKPEAPADEKPVTETAPAVEEKKAEEVKPEEKVEEKKEEAPVQA